MRLKWYFIRRSHKNKTVDLVKILEKIAMTLEVTALHCKKQRISVYEKITTVKRQIFVGRSGAVASGRARVAVV